MRPWPYLLCRHCTCNAPYRHLEQPHTVERDTPGPLPSLTAKSQLIATLRPAESPLAHAPGKLFHPKPRGTTAHRAISPTALRERSTIAGNPGYRHRHSYGSWSALRNTPDTAVAQLANGVQPPRASPHRPSSTDPDGTADRNAQPEQRNAARTVQPHTRPCHLEEHRERRERRPGTRHVEIEGLRPCAPRGIPLPRAADGRPARCNRGNRRAPLASIMIMPCTASKNTAPLLQERRRSRVLLAAECPVRPQTGLEGTESCGVRAGGPIRGSVGRGT